jgi:antitoxin YefM
MYANAYIDAMNAISVTELRKNLAAQIDRVTADHDYTIITREGGKPAAVLMSLEDFASWQETEYLLRSPANREALLASIAELDAGGGQVRDLIEE